MNIWFQTHSDQSHSKQAIPTRQIDNVPGSNWPECNYVIW